MPWFVRVDELDYTMVFLCSKNVILECRLLLSWKRNEICTLIDKNHNFCPTVVNSKRSNSVMKARFCCCRYYLHIIVAGLHCATLRHMRNGSNWDPDPGPQKWQVLTIPLCRSMSHEKWVQLGSGPRTSEMTSADHSTVPLYITWGMDPTGTSEITGADHSTVPLKQPDLGPSTVSWMVGRHTLYKPKTHIQLLRTKSKKSKHCHSHSTKDYSCLNIHHRD
jgi:hypothetical protein